MKKLILLLSAITLITACTHKEPIYKPCKNPAKINGKIYCEQE